MPMPSIAVSDPHFEDARGNNWCDPSPLSVSSFGCYQPILLRVFSPRSGPPEGLTLQRAIRALESYGHHAESILAGLALTKALLSARGCSTNGSKCGFPQQIDPLTAVPEPGDGYGPMIMSLLEYTARRVGITPVPMGTNATILFSAAYEAPGVSTQFTQKLGEHTLELASKRTGGTVAGTASLNGKAAFNFTSAAATAQGRASASGLVGVRVVATLSPPGVLAVSGVVGIADTEQTVRVGVASPCAGEVALSAKPNQEWGITCAGGKASAAGKRTTPFTAPHA